MSQTPGEYGWKEGLEDTRRDIERTVRAMLALCTPNQEQEECLTESLFGAIAEHKYWLLNKHGIDESKG